MSTMNSRQDTIIGSNIRRLREKHYPGRGGSKRCAIAMGVTPQQWSPWEVGSRTPSKAKLEKIADLFGVTVSDLLTGDLQNPDAAIEDHVKMKDVRSKIRRKSVTGHQNLDDKTKALICQGIEAFATLIVKEVFSQLGGLPKFFNSNR